MENILILDFDETMFQTKKLEIKYIEKIYNLKIDHYKYQKYGKIIAINVKKQNIITNYSSFWRNHLEMYQTDIFFHKLIEPFPDMIKTVQDLSKKYKIVIATGRINISKFVIQDILDKFIPNCISDIHCVWRTENGKHIKSSKKEYVKQLEGKKIAFLDDNIDELIEMDNLIPCYLFRPYLNSVPHKNIQIISSWKEISGKFLY